MKSLCGLGERHKIYKQEPFFVLNKTNSVDAARWALNVTNLQFAKHLNGKGKWVALQARHTIYKMQYYPNLSSVAQYGTLTLPPSSMNLRKHKSLQGESSPGIGTVTMLPSSMTWTGCHSPLAARCKSSRSVTTSYMYSIILIHTSS